MKKFNSWKAIIIGKKSGISQNNIVKSLIRKGVIIVDNVSNSNLTEIGNKILDNFDRDKKINDLLNE